MNGRPIGSSVADAPLLWPLAPGTHRIAARAEHDRTADTTITVR